MHIKCNVRTTNRISFELFYQSDHIGEFLCMSVMCAGCKECSILSFECAERTGKLFGSVYFMNSNSRFNANTLDIVKAI